MKKGKYILFTALTFIAINTFVSCSKNDSVKDDDQAQLINYQQSLNKIFKNVSSDLKISKKFTNEYLKESFEKSYLKVYRENANLERFNTAFSKFNRNAHNTNIQVTSSNNSFSEVALSTTLAHNQIDQILFSSATELDAIASLDLLVLDKNVIYEDKLIYISMRETILFLSDISYEFSLSGIVPTPAAKKATVSDIVPTTAPKKATVGWWQSWGKCTAIIMGGGIVAGTTLGLAGAAVGTIALPFVGTVSAGFVGFIAGAIGGSLTGAATGC